MALKMVGTPGKMVGFFLWMAFKVSSKLKRGNITILEAVLSARFITAVIAKTWKNGITAKNVCW